MPTVYVSPGGFNYLPAPTALTKLLRGMWEMPCNCGHCGGRGGADTLAFKVGSEWHLSHFPELVVSGLKTVEMSWHDLARVPPGGVGGGGTVSGRGLQFGVEACEDLLGRLPLRGRLRICHTLSSDDWRRGHGTCYDWN